MRIHTLIIGGGAAGLWLLDELNRRGVSALLLEANELGRGQTIASQGILHGGLKYTLQGRLTDSAAGVREMPQVWRDCLAGRRAPELMGTPVRAEHCYLWRTTGMTSRLGMFGAKFGLRVAPTSLNKEQRPAVLCDCPGSVAKLEEQVISPAGLIANLAARNREWLLKIDANNGLDFLLKEPGVAETVWLTHPETGRRISLVPRNIVLTAGAGNAKLRERLGLTSPIMQRRPLHMVMLRGELPVLNGHCVDGKSTRVTITSDVDSAGRTVWQVGGKISEDGVALDSAALIRHAKSELQATLPGLDLTNVDWTTYRVDRAEFATKGGKRPGSFHVSKEGHVFTAWPTKLVLVPRLAETLAEELCEDRTPCGFDLSIVRTFPRPTVARPPWESTEWTSTSVRRRIAA